MRVDSDDRVKPVMPGDRRQTDRRFPLEAPDLEDRASFRSHRRREGEKTTLPFGQKPWRRRHAGPSGIRNVSEVGREGERLSAGWHRRKMAT